MKRILWVVLSLSVLLCTGFSAQAGIIFQLGNNPQPNQENVQFVNNQSAPVVFGLTNQSNSTVMFTSTTDNLTTTSAGQAKVGASDGEVNNIQITTPGKFFTSAILNPFKGSGTATVTVVANEPGGGQQTFTFSYALGNGQNFLTITSTGGETIDSVTVDSTEGFQDLRQPRLGGIGVAVIPEPGSIMLLGIGAVSLIGYGIRRQRATLMG